MHPMSKITHKTCVAHILSNAQCYNGIWFQAKVRFWRLKASVVEEFYRKCKRCSSYSRPAPKPPRAVIGALLSNELLDTISIDFPMGSQL